MNVDLCHRDRTDSAWTNPLQVILFTTTLSHQRSDFFYNSRVIFESLFIQRFQNGVTMPRDTYTAYNIQDMYSEFEYISRQVCRHTGSTFR